MSVVLLCDGAQYFLPLVRQWLHQAQLNAVCYTIEGVQDHGLKPDLIIYSWFGQHHQTYRLLAPTLFVSGENWNADGHVVDAAWLTTTNPLLFPKSRREPLYCPFWFLSFAERLYHSVSNLDQDRTPLLSLKTRFCSYLYRNPNRPDRQNFCRLLSSTVSRVDTLGPDLNEHSQFGDQHIDRGYGTDYDRAVLLHIPYRFVIAFENTEGEGYCTEKIVNAFLAGAVPIYWGAPDVGETFNEAAFIHVRNFESWQDVANHIQYLETYPAAYEAMLREPIFKRNIDPQPFMDQLRELLSSSTQKC